jgi:hypothetical protein
MMGSGTDGKLLGWWGAALMARARLRRMNRDLARQIKLSRCINHELVLKI